MAAEVVDDSDVARFQGGDKGLFGRGLEVSDVNGAVDNAGFAESARTQPDRDRYGAVVATRVRSELFGVGVV